MTTAFTESVVEQVFVTGSPAGTKVKQDQIPPA